MENYNRQRSSKFARIIILLLTAVCFLTVSVFVAGKLRAGGSLAPTTYLYLLEPTALLIAAYALWRMSLLGDALASLASGWVVYALFVDILWSIATYARVSVLSERALKAYWEIMFVAWRHYPDRPYYFMLLTLAVLILSYSLASILRTLLCRLRVTAHGI